MLLIVLLIQLMDGCLTALHKWFNHSPFRLRYLHLPSRLTKINVVEADSPLCGIRPLRIPDLRPARP
jgi:hypothetical protein